MNETDQSGFSALVAILILVLVGVVGFTGWYVYSSQKKTNDTLTNTANSQDEPQKATQQIAANQSSKSMPTLQIKEWKLELTLSDATKDTQYAFAPGSNSTLYVYSKSVADKYSGCQGGGYTIVRANGSDTFGETSITYEAASKDPEMSKDVKKVSSYYYRRVSHGTYCTEQSTSAEKAAAEKLTPTFNTLASY